MEKLRDFCYVTYNWEGWVDIGGDYSKKQKVPIMLYNFF